MDTKWLIIAAVGTFVLASAAVVMMLLPVIKQGESIAYHDLPASQQPGRAGTYECCKVETPSTSSSEEEREEKLQKAKEKLNETAKVPPKVFQKVKQAFEHLKNKTTSGKLAAIVEKLKKKMNETTEEGEAEERNETSTRPRKLGEETLKYQIGAPALVVPPTVEANATTLAPVRIIPAAAFVTIGKVPLIPIVNVTVPPPLVIKQLAVEAALKNLAETTTTTTKAHKIGGEIEPPKVTTTPKAQFVLPKTAAEIAQQKNELPFEGAERSRYLRIKKRNHGLHVAPSA